MRYSKAKAIQSSASYPDDEAVGLKNVEISRV